MRTPIATKLRITTDSGAEYYIDREAKMFKQTKHSSALQHLQLTGGLIYGTYWTLRPDPPQEGGNLRIWGPDPRTDRPRLIELSNVHIEVWQGADTD